MKFASNMADAAAIFSGLSLIVGFAATPNMILLPLLTRKFNNRTIMIFWQALNTGAYLILALVGFQNLPQSGISVFVITALRFVACFNAIGSLQPLMISEIADYQQWKTGYRLDGFIQTFTCSLTMVVSQLAMFIPALIQDKMGFNIFNYQVKPGVGGIAANEMAENVLTQDMIDIANRYANVAIWISVASGALMLLCLCFYTLNKKKHAQIINDLKANSVNTDEIESEKGSFILTDINLETGSINAGALAEEIIETEIVENKDNVSEPTDVSPKKEE